MNNKNSINKKVLSPNSYTILTNSKAFTLVELIVVITILIILGTIAFISFTGYSQSSRDSKRIADVNSMQKSLELFITEKGTYPIPDNNTNITYSGGITWIQGTVGDSVIRNVENINKKPLDPLTGTEYTYSITSAKTEFQIGTISEGGPIGYKLPIKQTHAATTKRATAMIRGTYNERYLKVQSGTLNWILALPSIISTDTTQTDVQTILTNNKLVYNNYQNIPHSYNNAGYIMTGGFNYTNTNPLIYTGTLKSLTEDNASKLTFITNLKAVYNGTILQGEANYKEIVNTDLSNGTGAVYLVNRFINTNIGGIKVSNIILPTSGITTETSSSSPISPTNLSLSHSSRSKTFTFSWTAGDDNGGSCKLQYYKNGTTWTDISATTYNCDTTLSNQSVTLPGDGWNGSWNSIQVRVIRTSDSEELGTFTQNLTCSGVTGSTSATPSIDEDCNGQWDNIEGVGSWILADTDYSYYYGGSSNGCGQTLAQCQTWAGTSINYISLVHQIAPSNYPLYCCYGNNTGVKTYIAVFASAQQYVRNVSGSYY